MNLSSNTVLVTGGASGIGLALATRFHRAGSTVAICGRREDKLREARERLPGLLTRVCDLSQPAERRALAAWVTSDVPGVNVLVNNAGVQRFPRIAEGEGTSRTDTAGNRDQLRSAGSPHGAADSASAAADRTPRSSTSPRAWHSHRSRERRCTARRRPRSIHSRCRCAIRWQQLPLEVIEIAPPAVDTDLGGPGLHTWGVNVDEFLDAVMPRLAAGELEIGYGFSDETRHASRRELDEVFQRINQRS